MLVQAPGSSHSIVSDEGCVVLVIWEEPVVFEAQ
jgi:anti-sigma factor ChrR (cupin superfamily)